jgi:hypothetical protein
MPTAQEPKRIFNRISKIKIDTLPRTALKPSDKDKNISKKN